MKQDWQDLTKMTQGSQIIVERVRLAGKKICIEGEFELPALCRLSVEEQMFVMAFIKCHGSIKEMESVFGVSYPTIKNRLNKIAGQMEWVEINPPASKTDILDLLESGEIDINEAERRLRR